MLVSVYTCQNATLLEISCTGSIIVFHVLEFLETEREKRIPLLPALSYSTINDHRPTPCCHAEEKLNHRGHRELIIYPIDHNGETLVFYSLFCISQQMWGITICLKFKPKVE